MKTYILKVVAITLSLFLLMGVFKYIGHLKSELKRVELNQSELLTENGALKSERNALKLNTTELKYLISANESYKQMLHDELSIKEKKIKNLTIQLNSIKVDTVTQIRDSVIYKDSIKYVAKYAEIKNNYIDASVLLADSAKWEIHMTDTAIVVVHDKANFFQRLFGKHKITGSVVNRSPYSSLYLDKVIIKK